MSFTVYNLMHIHAYIEFRKDIIVKLKDSLVKNVTYLCVINHY
jgi:hypothetical protein